MLHDLVQRTGLNGADLVRQFIRREHQRQRADYAEMAPVLATFVKGRKK